MGEEKDSSLSVACQHRQLGSDTSHLRPALVLGPLDLRRDSQTAHLPTFGVDIAGAPVGGLHSVGSVADGSRPCVGGNREGACTELVLLLSCLLRWMPVARSYRLGCKKG